MTHRRFSFGCMSNFFFFFGQLVLIVGPRASRPSDFSYKHDAKHNSMFMVAKAWDDTDDEALVLELTQVLDGAKTGSP
jgi:general transcription factor 3C protein 4